MVLYGSIRLFKLDCLVYYILFSKYILVLAMKGKASKSLIRYSKYGVGVLYTVSISSSILELAIIACSSVSMPYILLFSGHLYQSDCL